MRRQPGVGLVLTPLHHHVKLPDEYLANIRVTAAALEATLPTPLQPMRLVGRGDWEAIYTAPSHALYVVQQLHESLQRFPYRIGIASGYHWTDTIDLMGQTIAPDALARARLAAKRTSVSQSTWIVLEGLGAWDAFGTATLNLLHSIRLQRSPAQRLAAAAVRDAGSIKDALNGKLGKARATVSTLIQRSHAVTTWRVELELAQHLDGAFSAKPKWP